jgi:F0F1-type ATP synthase membrane subunit b/b'
MDFLFILVAVGLGIYLFISKKSAAKEQERLNAEIEASAKANADLQAENQALARFRAILDAQAEADRILADARRTADEAQRAANGLREKAGLDAIDALTKAEEEAKNLRSQANQALKEAREKVESIMGSAHREAKTVIDNATKRGEEIAGSAFEAVRNAERYEQIAKAMKNLIEGYGDQYVIPSRSLLDELASDYGFTEAGEELKNARERSRLMVKGHTAATCDYVEANRKETAIRFVTDAFNGKVDSILSRTKNDNVGKLEQEIRDAFNLVNFNGAAFRNARILEGYLDARLTELRWAATVQEIKLRDREEQRRIKDQIREEERAQREFERSMREAAKEEESLRKAMEKIQAQVEKASAEQREKFEAQLAEMAEKLRQAEERNQRAMSMAQQTRMGHVYVISNVGSFGEDVIKIGLTRRLEPLDRIRELGDASVPFSFDVHAMIFNEDAPALETALHRHFLTARVNKVNPRKEFFRVPVKIIREELDKLGIKAQWTMTSEAKEYRETLAIERALHDDPAKGRQWLQSQTLYDATTELFEEESETLS